MLWRSGKYRTVRGVEQFGIVEVSVCIVRSNCLWIDVSSGFWVVRLVGFSGQDDYCDVTKRCLHSKCKVRLGG
jgi:hypothetical protein